ncbi:MAG: AmmeMemoRadiSam system protein B [Elusimicrobia bacterium]|nr:AmmeMemoRadiSam system protein B [Elusimicrobiota bacterium]
MSGLLLSIPMLFFCAAPAAARQPAVAGQFYPADPAALGALADKYLAAGPGEKGPAGIVAVVAPHAGYEFSGRLAGLAYRFIDARYDTVVILAAGHTEAVKGAALLATDDYETPLGKVATDRELAAALRKASPLFEDRPSAHAREHAVEVQLPFLQRKLRKPFKLLAATLNAADPADLKKIGAALAAALRGKKALLVISTDLSHYPSHALAQTSDGTMALAMRSMDPGLVYGAARAMAAKKVPGLETCACGSAALAAGMEAARLLGARSFVKLGMSDSSVEAPAAGGPERVVGYIAGALVKGGEADALALSMEQKAALLKEARLAIANAFEGARPPAGLEEDARQNLPCAAFVTLTIAGRLRGCVGTVDPVMTLADAVRYGAYSAAFRDGRFEPLTKEELERVKIEVSLLSPLRPAQAAEITPWKHGVAAAAGGKSGLFLPQVWEQIPSKEEFLAELCSQKAGLSRDCWKDKAVSLYTFTVEAFSE